MTQTRVTTVAFKCQEAEHQAIKEMAAAAGCSVSKFVRDTVLRAIEHEAGGSRSLADTDRPLVLSAKTQDKLVRGLFMLVVDRHRQLQDEDRGSYLEDILNHAQRLFDEGQAESDPSSGDIADRHGAG